MARGGRYGQRNYRGRRRSKSAGQYAREKHVREAEQLTRELGGADQIVKSWFFSASDDDLKAVLDEYERQFGAGRRAYAEGAIDQWMTGRRRMSGVVAERLFKVIPRFMPAADRLRIAEHLWRHLLRNERVLLEVNPQAPEDEIIASIVHHVASAEVSAAHIESYRERFEWLEDGEVLALNDILAHLARLHRDAVIAAASNKVSMLVSHLRTNADIDGEIRETFDASGVSVTVRFSRSVDGIRRVQSFRRSPSEAHSDFVPRNAQPTSNGGTGCVWIVIIAVILLVILAL